MRTRTLRALSFLVPAALASAGCSSDDAPSDEGLSIAGARALCGDAWAVACESAACDPNDALWSDCRRNGWSGYDLPESCPVETGYAGDDRAPCAPDPEDGFQLRFGPADYTNAADLDKHAIPPAGDSIECVYLPLPNTDDRYLGHLFGRVRPGAHHTQLRFLEHEPTSSSASEFCLPFGGEVVHMGQMPDFEVPDLRTPSPSPESTTPGGLDFAGGAIALGPGRVLAIELHYQNPTPDPLLREGWINFYYQKEGAVAHVLRPLMLIGAGITVPPSSTGIVRRSCEAPSALSVTHLQGHSHEGATRFTIWTRKAATGELTRVYESYDPSEPALLAYSAAVENLEPSTSARAPGGASGVLALDAGDSLVWECEIDNPRSTPIVDGGPNERGDQMCYTFGNFIAPDGGAATWSCGAKEESAF